MQLTKDSYFKPELSDFWEGVTYYMASANADFNKPPETWGLIQLMYRIGMHDNIFDKYRDTQHPYLVGSHIYMKYLTSADIEGYGSTMANQWEQVNNLPWMVHMAINAPIITWFKSGKWYLSFAEATRMLGIYERDDEQSIVALHASCYCRDINRFRMIISMVVEALDIFRKELPDKFKIDLT